MGMFFGLVGVAGMLVFGIMMLFSKQYRVKKVFYAFLASIVLFIFGIAITPEPKEVPQEKVKAETKKVPEKKETKIIDTAKAEEKKKAEAEKVAAEKVKAENEKKQQDLADMQEYADAMSGIIGDLTTEVTRFSELNRLGAEAPALMMMEDWTVPMAATLLAIDSHIEKIRNLQAPPSMQDVHDLNLQIADKWEFVVDNYPVAIDTLNSDLLMECVTNVQQSIAITEQATKLMEDKLIAILN